MMDLSYIFLDFGTNGKNASEIAPTPERKTKD